MSGTIALVHARERLPKLKCEMKLVEYLQMGASFEIKISCFELEDAFFPFAASKSSSDQNDKLAGTIKRASLEFKLTIEEGITSFDETATNSSFVPLKCAFLGSYVDEIRDCIKVVTRISSVLWAHSDFLCNSIRCLPVGCACCSD